MKSDLGEKTWRAHNDLGVKICDSQAEWTPIQREFLMLAFNEYEADETDLPPEARKYA